MVGFIVDWGLVFIIVFLYSDMSRRMYGVVYDYFDNIFRWFWNMVVVDVVV